MTNREEMHLLAGAYALGALNESEREDFEQYLLTSEEARAEVASLSDTAVMLGLATEPVSPPPALRASILAQVAATPQLPAVAERSNVTAIFGDDSARYRPATAARVQRRWYARPATLLVAAAAVIALFIGSNVVSLVNSNMQQSQEASSVTEISAASDSQHASSTVVGGGKATLIWSNKLQKSVVVLDKMASLPADKTYELWYIAGSDIRPAGTFTAADSGKTVQVLQGKMTDGDTVGITVEPAGGSKHPTTRPVAAIPTA